MKKNKLYIFFSLLIVILLFSVAALCNQCGLVTSATTETSAAGDKTDVEESKESATEESTDKSEESAEETTDKTEETSATEDTSDYEAPTIKLEIYEGPTYHADDDVCYYRVKAVVTGKPIPAVKFSKDDSGGSWGKLKTQVNIHRGETYTLTATAKNTKGEDTDSLVLTWGCNNNPVINDITLSSATILINKTYDVTASATDPDGDSLTYEWTVSGGAINNDAANPMKWTTPNTAGDYTITVKVTDGKGGEATKSKTVSASAPASVNLVVPRIPAEGGYVAQGGVPINVGGCLYAGDSTTNKYVCGYISYDISGLTGAIIQNASLTFTIKTKWGDPSFFASFCVYDTYWGTNQISGDTISIGGTAIQYINTINGNFIVNNATLKNQLQGAISAGHPRFQLGVAPQGSLTDGDGAWDGFDWDQSGVVLNITYIPGS
jgi:hypothetical protein